YADGICGGKQNLGHYGGRIRNNTFFVNDLRLGLSREGVDTGIGLEEACNVEVANNTIVSTVGFRSSAIEWRFPATTGIVVMNNLANGRIFARDGAAATLKSNVANASTRWFLSVNGEGDLHPAPSIMPALPRGTAISDLAVDKDGRPRAVP